MGKLALAITGIAAAAILSTVALTDKHPEPHATGVATSVMYTWDSTLEPLRVVQYNAHEEFVYPSAAEAAFVAEIPEAEVMNALIMNTVVDGYQFKYEYK